MRTKVIAVVGSKGAGKTTTIEILAKEMTNRGYKVNAVKHIHEPDFTTDKVGKDTWRFAQSGVGKVIIVAPAEIATIEKTATSKFSAKDILQRSEDADLVLVEGFKKLVSKNIEIPKIVAVKSAEEVVEALKTFKPIFIFAGLERLGNLDLNVPYVNIPAEAEKIADAVENYVREE